MTSSSPGKSKELLEDEVKPLVESSCANVVWNSQRRRRRSRILRRGSTFLSQNVRRYSHGKLWTKPSKKNTHTFLEKVRSHVKEPLNAPTWRLATELNRMTRG